VVAYPIPEYVYSLDIQPFINYRAAVLPDDAPLQDALVALGRSEDQSVLLTKGTTKELAGILTISDLQRLERFNPSEYGTKKARDLATMSRVVGVNVDAKLDQLLRLINGENSTRRPFDRVPVLDLQKNVVGIITRHRLNEQMRQIEASGSVSVGSR
jgi:CBS domain-containing protein